VAERLFSDYRQLRTGGLGHTMLRRVDTVLV
jgi:hypothetical protein